MSLIKWEPFGDLDRFFNNDDLPGFRDMGWDLSADVYEKDGNIIAEMNVPGVDPDKLDVSVEDGYMRVSGSREEKDEKKEKNYYSKQIRYGSFEKTVRLPDHVDAGNATAEYENGKLTVTIPKPSEEKKKDDGICLKLRIPPQARSSRNQR